MARGGTVPSGSRCTAAGLTVKTNMTSTYRGKLPHGSLWTSALLLKVNQVHGKKARQKATK